jgi:hypothetical protein
MIALGHLAETYASSYPLQKINGIERSLRRRQMIVLSPSRSGADAG